MEQDELVQRAKQGDVDCFNRLVEHYQREVYNLCLHMRGDAAAAEDATQDAFLSAFRGIGRFRGGNFRAWLFRIAANACRDQRRSAHRRPTSPLDDVPFDMESGDPSPDDLAANRELGAAIKRSLAALPYDRRLAVVLRDIEGLEYEEIARVIGCSMGTVKSRIGRGRATLRRDLAQFRELFPGF
jgi:RNA polymerase sigma-70 factor (ECF subfamily)